MSHHVIWLHVISHVPCFFNVVLNVDNLRSFRHWHWAGWGTPLDLWNDDHDDMVDLFYSASQAALRQPKSGNLMAFQID